MDIQRNAKDWRSIPKEDLRRRLDAWNLAASEIDVLDPIMSRLGCVMSASRRANGDGQIKIRSGKSQWAPRPWQVDGFLKDVDIDKLEGSHLCGIGSAGLLQHESHPLRVSRLQHQPQAVHSVHDVPMPVRYDTRRAALPRTRGGCSGVPPVGPLSACMVFKSSIK